MTKKQKYHVNNFKKFKFLCFKQNHSPDFSGFYNRFITQYTVFGTDFLRHILTIFKNRAIMQTIE